MKDLFPAENIEIYKKSKCNKCSAEDSQKRFLHSNLCLHKM